MFCLGVLFILFSLFKICEWIINLIFYFLCIGILVGIGLFLVFIVLKNVGIVVDNLVILVFLGVIILLYVVLVVVGFFLMIGLVYCGVKGVVMIVILVVIVFGFVFGDV